MIRLLGEGGMGKVMLAEDRETGRRVAVKLLRFDPAERVEFFHRLQVEARAQARVRHPNLVGIYDCNFEAPPAFLVMEYVEGEDLGEVLRRRGRLPAREAAPIVRGVARAVLELHRQGVLHRDLKPSNVLLRRDDGEAVVMDLGLARLDDGPSLTGTGNFVGTPYYLPPEVVTDGEWTRAGDQYQLGAVLYELLTGRTLLQVRGLDALVHASRAEKLLDFTGLEVPEDLQALVRRAVRLDPGARFGDVAAFESALADFEEGRARRFSAAGSAPARPNRNRNLGLGLLALLAGVLTSRFLVGPASGSPRDLRWKVLGDRVVVDLRPEGARDLRLLVDGRPVETEWLQGSAGTRLVHRGLEAGQRAWVQLVWQGGASPRVELQGGEAAVGAGAELVGPASLRISVLRSCLALWAGSARVLELSPGPQLLPLPEGGARILELVVDEEGLRSTRRFDLEELVARQARRCLEQLRVVAPGEQLRQRARTQQGPSIEFSSLREAWQPLLRWFPRLFSGEVQGLDPAALWAGTDQVALLAAQERLLGAPGEELVFPTRGPGARAARLPAEVHLEALERHRIGGGAGATEEGPPPRHWLKTPGPSLLGGRHLEAAEALRLGWPRARPALASHAWVAVWVEKLDGSASLRLLAEGGEGPRILGRLVAPAPPPGESRRRYQGWLTLALPAPVLPRPGEAVTLTLEPLLLPQPATALVGSVRVGWP